MIKDIDEGKMWYYYIYVMCDKIRQAEMECYEEEVEKRDKNTKMTMMTSLNAQAYSVEVVEEVV